MATAQQTADLRVMIDESTQNSYTDVVLGERIDIAADNLQIVAAAIWREKAASFSGLVDVQEGTSKRALGNLYANALRMASYYDGVNSAEAGDGVTFRAARTRAITRP